MAFADTIRTARPTRENIATLIEQAGLAYPSYCTSVSGATTITAVCSGLAAYTAGFKIIFRGASPSASSPTINLNGLGAKSFKMPDGSAPIGGEISDTSFTEAVYDGTNFILHSFSPVWTDFSLGTPTANAGSISGYTVSYLKFKHYGDSIKIKGRLETGTQASAAATWHTFTAPKASRNLGDGQALFATMSQSSPSAARPTGASISNNSTSLIVYGNTDLTATGFAVGSGIIVQFFGEYLC